MQSNGNQNEFHSENSFFLTSSKFFFVDKMRTKNAFMCRHPYSSSSVIIVVVVHIAYSDEQIMKITWMKRSSKNTQRKYSNFVLLPTHRHNRNRHFQRNTNHYHYHSIARISHKVLFLIVEEEEWDEKKNLWRHTFCRFSGIHFDCCSYSVTARAKTNTHLQLVSLFYPLTWTNTQQKLSWLKNSFTTLSLSFTHTPNPFPSLFKW